MFSFQLTDPDQFGLFLVHMRFYGGLDVYTTMIPDGTEMPFDLTLALMNGGIHTIISADGKVYEFNAEQTDE